ncbi:DUF6418 domain-containing protein [Chromohalobacter israelensis]|uniref:DUF6418 domain-containing protein n=1 Tax=Chromohalobacter israelensis TaxID=141390 RepID=UPI0012EC6EA0|nr:DUF6418 domain-containing protein [Chromohalobacter israelensis]MDF9435626.1 DUF6418 domain-containing protein [Chromohalobacter israelensis]
MGAFYYFFTILIYAAFVGVMLLPTISKKWFPFVLPFFISITWCFFSLLYIESGAYMSETTVKGRVSGAAVVYLINVMLTCIGFYLGWLVTYKNKLKTKKLVEIKLSIHIVWLVVLAIAVINCYYGVVNGFPYFEGMDRNNYWNAVDSGVQRAFFNQLPVCGFLLGYLIFAESYRRFTLLLLVMIMTIQVFYSETFTALFMTIMLFLIPVLLGNYHKQRSVYKDIVKPFLVIFPALFCLGVGAIYYKFFFLTNLSFHDGWEKLVERVFALQGQVFYVGLEKFNSGVRFDSALSFSENSYSSMEKVMYIIAPNDIVDSYLERGVNFTMGYPISLYLAFGYLGFIPVAFFSLFLGGVVAFLCRALESYNLFASLVLIKMYGLLYVVMGSGNYEYIFSYKIALYCVLAFLFCFVSVVVSGKESSSNGLYSYK